MSMLDAMDFQVAVIAHLNWKSKLSDFFYGIEDLTAADVPDHTTCEFGKWLYATGLKNFSNFSDIHSLEAMHKEVHAEIKKLVAMPKETRMSEEGKQALAVFKGKCDQLVRMMESMEKQAQNK